MIISCIYDFTLHIGIWLWYFNTGSPEDDGSFILLHNLRKHFTMTMEKIMMMILMTRTTFTMMIMTVRQMQREKGRMMIDE